MPQCHGNSCHDIYINWKKHLLTQVPNLFHTDLSSVHLPCSKGMLPSVLVFLVPSLYSSSHPLQLQEAWKYPYNRNFQFPISPFSPGSPLLSAASGRLRGGGVGEGCQRWWRIISLEGVSKARDRSRHRKSNSMSVSRAIEQISLFAKWCPHSCSPFFWTSLASRDVRVCIGTSDIFWGGWGTVASGCHSITPLASGWTRSLWLAWSLKWYKYAISDFVQVDFAFHSHKPHLVIVQSTGLLHCEHMHTSEAHWAQRQVHMHNCSWALRLLLAPPSEWWGNIAQCTVEGGGWSSSWEQTNL